MIESFSAFPALKAFPSSVVASSFPFSSPEKVTLKNTLFPSWTVFVRQDSKVNNNATTTNSFVFIKHLHIF